jgi:hypothetical protein
MLTPWCHTAGWLQDAASSSGVSAGRKLQVAGLYAAILADIFVTAYTDTLRSTEELTIILLLRCLLLLLVVSTHRMSTTTTAHR